MVSVWKLKLPPLLVLIAHGCSGQVDECAKCSSSPTVDASTDGGEEGLIDIDLSKDGTAGSAGEPSTPGNPGAGGTSSADAGG
jgi:hypothetical protein